MEDIGEALKNEEGDVGTSVNNTSESIFSHLGVTAVDQEEFEAKIIDDVESKLFEIDKSNTIKADKKELMKTIKKIIQSKQKLQKIEKTIKELSNEENIQGKREIQRKISSLLDDQEKQSLLINDLFKLQNEYIKGLEKHNYDIKDDPDISLPKNEIFDDTTVEDIDALTVDLYDEKASERENCIKKGEMTPFGTLLYQALTNDSDDKNDIGNFNTEHEKSSCPNTSQVSKVWAKAKRKIEQRKLSDSEDDWEEDYESGDSINESELPRKKQKRSRSVLDDGDTEVHLNRINLWKENLSKEEKKYYKKSEEIEEDYKVPLAVWKRLYNYQKVCVRWFWELHRQQVGGILGDEMGLGKTIQIISFLAGLSFSRIVEGRFVGLGPSIIVCPSTVMHQWVSEFHKWWPYFRVCILHGSGSHRGSKWSLVQSVHSSNGILGLVQNQEILLARNWHYIVLDEGHKIRNPDAQATLAAKQFRTCHRLILSGSPLQNNLRELWSLFDFIYPGKLGTLPVFMAEFSVPITLGGYANATSVQVTTAHKCAMVLKDTINPYLLRRMKADVKHHISLTEKNEQVLFCRLTNEQRRIYREYVNSKEISSILDGRIKIFVGLINLRKICNHPDLFTGGPKNYDIPLDEIEEEDKYGYYKRSGKMIVLKTLLKLWKSQGHRVLLFTQSKQMLLILEKFMSHLGYSYMKMDGTTSVGSRMPLITKFNNSFDVFVFLLTTKVGGLGVNLTGANRVIIFDPDWNPSTDIQARERAWRIGQKKNVTIYRLMVSGTIEEKIYHRQIFKQFLVNRVLKDPKQKRFFKSNDLYELFTLKEDDTNKTETSAIFAGTNSEISKGSVSKKNVHIFKPKQEKINSKKDEVKDCLQKLYEEEPSDKNKSADADDSEMQKRKLAKALSKNFHSILSGSDNKSKICVPLNLKNKEEVGISKKRHKLKKKKHKKTLFEGTPVSHLTNIKLDESKNAESEKEKRKTQLKQDDYVLASLFSKSDGIHSGLDHDAIMNGEGSDYVLIEADAEKCAKDAIKAVRESRRECNAATSGVPNFTGINGAKPAIKRFGKKNSKAKTSMSSADLLQKMKERNKLIKGSQNQEAEEDNLFMPDNSNNTTTKSEEEMGNIELLTDIRNFISFQSKVNGQASTAELLQKFKTDLPPQKSPLFKALLNQISDFHRDSSGCGIWKLKTEFR